MNLTLTEARLSLKYDKELNEIAVSLSFTAAKFRKRATVSLERFGLFDGGKRDVPSCQCVPPPPPPVLHTH